MVFSWVINNFRVVPSEGNLDDTKISRLNGKAKITLSFVIKKNSKSRFLVFAILSSPQSSGHCQMIDIFYDCKIHQIPLKQ